MFSQCLLYPVFLAALLDPYLSIWHFKKIFLTTVPCDVICTSLLCYASGVIYSSQSYHTLLGYYPTTSGFLRCDSGVKDFRDLQPREVTIQPFSAAFGHLWLHSAILGARSCHRMPIFGDQFFRKKTTHQERCRSLAAHICRICLDYLA